MHHVTSLPQGEGHRTPGGHPDTTSYCMGQDGLQFASCSYDRSSLDGDPLVIWGSFFVKLRPVYKGIDCVDGSWNHLDTDFRCLDLETEVGLPSGKRLHDIQ